MANGDKYEHDDLSALQLACCWTVFFTISFHEIVRLFNRRCYIQIAGPHFENECEPIYFWSFRIFLLHTSAMIAKHPVPRVCYNIDLRTVDGDDATATEFQYTGYRRSFDPPKEKKYVSNASSVSIRMLAGLPSGCLLGCRVEKFICFACGGPAQNVQPAKQEKKKIMNK